MAPGDVPTPNASDLGRYGDIPVSYYTGRPDISIPIYTLKVRDMEFPLTLQYDASGVMVNSLPGWTGHNWTLTAGGVITRMRNNVCDEYIPVYQSTIAPFTNYFKSCHKLKEDMNNENVLKNNVSYNKYDYQPDIFTFNFMGKSGKFFLGNDGQWKVLCDENLDIIFDVDDENNYISPFIETFPGDITSTKQPKVIKGFTIRDDQGYIYEFGGTNDAIDYTTNFFRQSDIEKIESFFATSWYLTYIKDRFGNILYELKYKRGKFIAQFYNTAVSYYIYEKAKFYGSSYGQEFSHSNYSFPYGGVLNSPVYIDKIITPYKVSIEFDTSYSNTPTKDLYPGLDVYKCFSDYDYSDVTLFYYLQTDKKNIAQYQFEDKQGNKYANPLASTRLNELHNIIIKWGDSPDMIIELDYDYNSRMHLTDVRFYDRQKEFMSGSYHLNYNHYNMLPDNYLSTETDHWGFYNGRECKAGTLNIYNTRNSNPSTLQYGLLSEIIYPTGGKSVMTYECNDFSSCVSADRQTMRDSTGIAGGVRIKSITDYSDVERNEIARKRTFNYKNPKTGLSSGELFAAPRYSWSNWMASLETKEAIAMQSVTRSASIIPLSNSFGPHIGYSFVEEAEQDGTYTRYHYQNISASKDERFIKDFSFGKPSPFDMFTEKGYKRGKLLSAETYNNENSLMRKIKYGYTKENVETDYVLSSNLTYVNFGNSATFGYFTGGIYKLLFPKYDIVSDTTITFYDNGETIDYRHFNKENKKLHIDYIFPHETTVRLTMSESMTRNGESISKEYIYPFSANTPATEKLGSEMFCIRPIALKNYTNNIFTGGYRKNYRLSDTGMPILDSYMRINNDLSEDTIVKYHTYSPTYALNSYTERGKPVTDLKWTRDESFIEAINVGSDADKNNGMRSFTTRYFHVPLQGLNDIYYPNGLIIYYSYDRFNRLFEITDEDYHPFKRYRYNTRTQNKVYQ